MADASSGSREKVITPETDVVASTATDFKAALQHAVEAGVERLVIDLQAVKTVDPIGMAVIISAHNSMKKFGGAVAITNAPQDLHKLFTMMRLNEHFEIHSAN